MRLTIEFEPEFWRVKGAWRRFLCRHFGHPGWKAQGWFYLADRWSSTYAILWHWYPASDPTSPVCIRCGAGDR